MTSYTLGLTLRTTNRKATAITRTRYSRPVQTALKDGVIRFYTKVFDYGCGRGDDVRLLQQGGYMARGFDPHWCPAKPKLAADVVMLSYVLNVIEDYQERARVLADAWSLAGQVLVVSVRTNKETVKGIAMGDGILTSRNTFQKLYHPLSAVHFIESVTGVPAIQAAPGIFYCYKA